MRKLPNVFNKEQIKQLLKAIDEPWLMVAILLGIFCGLRRMEVSNLKAEHIDLTTRRLRVENSKNPNKSIEGYGKDRMVPVPQFLTPVLKLWIQLIGGQGYLFPSLKNPAEPVSKEHLWRAYNQALQRAGLNDVIKNDAKGMRRHKYNFHTLRHTYATLLWEKTGDILTVKSALGHAKIETTMIYTHVTNAVIEQKVNDAFSNKFTPKLADTAISDPIGILARRFAMGEITKEQFRSLRQELRQEQENQYIG